MAVNVLIGEFRALSCSSSSPQILVGNAVAQLVDALRYEPAGRAFDFR